MGQVVVLLPHLLLLPMVQAEADRLQRQQEEEGRARAAERHAKARGCCG